MTPTPIDITNAHQFVTEADARARERTAWENCAEWVIAIVNASGIAWTPSLAEVLAEANRRYPAPVPPRTLREIEDPEVPSTRWRCPFGHIVWQTRGGCWYPPGAVIPTRERIRIWSDLMAHPWTDASGATYATEHGE